MRADFSRGFFELPLGAAGNGDLCSGARQCYSTGASDSPAATGNEGALAVQAERRRFHTIGVLIDMAGDGAILRGVGSSKGRKR